VLASIAGDRPGRRRSPLRGLLARSVVLKREGAAYGPPPPHRVCYGPAVVKNVSVRFAVLPSFAWAKNGTKRFAMLSSPS
jgi:hypothetical protein